MTRAGIFCGLLLGCGAPETIPKEDFARAAADIICERSRQCVRGQFDAAYFGMADCVASFERELGVLVELNDFLECDYDAAEAASAYTQTAEMSCEDFYEGDYLTAAAEVWGDDCGGFIETYYYDR